MHLGHDALLDLLSLDDGHRLRHLAECFPCRSRLRAILLEATLPGPESVYLVEEELVDTSGDPERALPMEPLERRLFLRAIEIFDAERLRLENEVRQVVPILDGLLALPEDTRLSLVESVPRYSSTALSRALLRRADAAALDQPLQSHHLAALAVAVLDRLPESSETRRQLATAYSLLAHAEQRRGRLEAAEDFLKGAVDRLRNAPMTEPPRAVLCYALASLRRDQQRADEALALFERAKNLSEELGEHHDFVRAALAQGQLLLDEHDPEAALLSLTEADNALDPTEHPRLLLSLLQTQALAYADLRRHDGLALVSSRLQDFILRVPLDSLDRVRVTRIQAQVARRLEDWTEAGRGLLSVFRDFLEAGSTLEAATAAFELAGLMFENRIEVDADLLFEIAGQLTALLSHHLGDVTEFALVSPLRRLPEEDNARPRRGYYMDVLQSAAEYLERAQFNPGLPFLPLPEPDLVLQWKDLSEQSRRQAAASAGVELNSDHQPKSLRDRTQITWMHEARTGCRIEFPEHDPDETLA
jgi:tetratricopeptide (TPR) repeat protein